MSKRNFAICVENSEYPASLEKRKIYEILADESASELGQIRIIDESGEDYLYPSSCFVDIHLTKAVEDAVVNAAAEQESGHKAWGLKNQKKIKSFRGKFKWSGNLGSMRLDS